MDAYYYPNLVTSLPCKLNGEWINATQDMMAACGEMRHFIDYRVIEQHEHYSLGSLIDPVPPCTKLTGTRTENGDRVLGMLPEPLTVKVKCKDILGDKSICFFDLLLDNVLVIDSLPVPLHISMKAIFQKVRANDDTVASSNSEQDIYTLINFCTNGDRESPESRTQHMLQYPAIYHDHAYWTSRPEFTFGLTPDMEERLNLLAAHCEKSQTSAQIRSCLKCGIVQTKLFKCGRCLKAFYCSTTCQRAHWSSHKPSCVLPTN
mmetsp:Transcript_6212/g.9263  ORF Transcript_6212/g.9263 Transcript_6212/m.9263 type:complete len:262 (-) Transcript_6212:1199-1984(-)